MNLGTLSTRPGCKSPGLPAAPHASSGQSLEYLLARTDRNDGSQRELRDLKQRLWGGMLLALPVLMLAIGRMLPAVFPPAWVDGRWAHLIEFIFTLPVVGWAGWPFFKHCRRSAQNRHLYNFTLIVLGMAAAFGFSVAALFLPGFFPLTMQHGGQVEPYFEAAALIVVLALLGQVLELRARHRTGSVSSQLLQLAPLTARRNDLHGVQEISLGAVKVGDSLRVAPGATIPVDGVVVEGTSSVAESMITGVSRPMAKVVGSKVIGGTINDQGSMIIRAERVGSDMLLGQIVGLLAEGQRHRAPVPGLVDKLVGIYVPMVLAIAALTYVLWMVLGPEPRLAHALLNTIAVLIIASPCALSLAAPISLTVAIGRGARVGVLIKSAEALESLAHVTTLVLDKSGTFTEGSPKLMKVVPAPGLGVEEVLRLAASLEQASDHPLAAAIVRGAKDQSMALSTAQLVRATLGGGVSGTVDGHTVSVGSRDFLRRENIMALEDLSALAAPFQDEGNRVVYVALQGQPAGILVVADKVKSTVAVEIRALQALGLKLVMLTGDDRLTAEHVAGNLDLDEVQAGLGSAEKAAYVARRCATGEHLAAFGHGLTDGPVLQAADVGLAMGSGARLLLPEADITLLQGDLAGVARAIQLSRALRRIIRQNYFLVFLYNACGIPIAAGALYPVFGLLLSPFIVGSVIGFSSVSVISNALRLREVKL